MCRSRGSRKPTPKDLSVLLSVRRRAIERALAWLKRNNLLYAGIRIDIAEMHLCPPFWSGYRRSRAEYWRCSVLRVQWSGSLIASLGVAFVVLPLVR